MTKKRYHTNHFKRDEGGFFRQCCSRTGTLEWAFSANAGISLFLKLWHLDFLCWDTYACTLSPLLALLSFTFSVSLQGAVYYFHAHSSCFPANMLHNTFCSDGSCALTGMFHNDVDITSPMSRDDGIYSQVWVPVPQQHLRKESGRGF
jgi:hypothetical protein